MTKPIEFSSFYKLLKEVLNGNAQKQNELEWILAEYEHAKDATSAYDELGQIFCHHGVMELYEYTGLDDIKYITSLETPVWKYLKNRMDIDLSKYMIKAMLNHANDHNLTKKLSDKWDTPISEIEENIGDLAQYVTDGIVELIY